MSFLHASPPRAVAPTSANSATSHSRTRTLQPSQSRAAPRPRYRDPLQADAEAATVYVQPNIMFDPRVVRGATVGRALQMAGQEDAALGATLARTTRGAVTSASAAAAPFAAASPAARPASTRPSKESLLQRGLIRPSQPSAAYIHSHIVVTKQRVEVPLHLYLVEQKEPTLTHTLDTQTDAMLAEPPTPAYVPRKRGLDAGTQVDTDMVFRFDDDVAAILEVLVSKSAEQALMEVREEEEMAAIESHREEMEAKMEREDAAAEELVQRERALFAQKEKLLAEARLQQQHTRTVRSKLAALHFTRRFLSALPAQTLSQLRHEGFFQADDAATQLELAYMPALVGAVDLELAKRAGARNMLEGLLGETIAKAQKERDEELARKAEIAAKRRAEEEAAAAAAAELARRQRSIELFIHSDGLAESPVGPLRLTGESTVSELENKVYRWMESNMEEEAVPPRERLLFRWNGELLDKAADTAVYDLGIGNLATLSMEVLPPPVEEKEQNEQGEDEEGEDDEDEEDEDDEEDDEDEL